MCTEVRNTLTNEIAESPDELRRMLGLPDLVIYPGYKRIDDACCLCQVDVRASLEAAGWKYHARDHDPMDVEATPPQ